MENKSEIITFVQRISLSFVSFSLNKPFVDDEEDD